MRRQATVQAQLDQTAEEKRKLLQKDIAAHEIHLDQRKHAQDKLKVRQIILSMCCFVCRFAITLSRDG